MAFPNMTGGAQLPQRVASSTAGSDFSNPKADALNKMRKKKNMHPSLMGLKAATSAKPPMSEGPPTQPGMSGGNW